MNPAPETQSVSMEYDLPYPPAKVWHPLTEPDLLAKWVRACVRVRRRGQRAAAYGWRTSGRGPGGAMNASSSGRGRFAPRAAS
jgi:uncharacterized protein YndB with AHSA1/START domain